MTATTTAKNDKFLWFWTFFFSFDIMFEFEHKQFIEQI